MTEIYKGPPKAQPPGKLLLDVKQVAEMLSVSQRLVYTLKNTGKLKSVRIGDRVLFQVSDIEAYIQRQLQAG